MNVLKKVKCLEAHLIYTYIICTEAEDDGNKLLVIKWSKALDSPF